MQPHSHLRATRPPASLHTQLPPIKAESMRSSTLCSVAALATDAPSDRGFLAFTCMRLFTFERLSLLLGERGCIGRDCSTRAVSSSCKSRLWTLSTPSAESEPSCIETGVVLARHTLRPTDAVCESGAADLSSKGERELDGGIVKKSGDVDLPRRCVDVGNLGTGLSCCGSAQGMRVSEREQTTCWCMTRCTL
jgi:hypothetical protein